MTFNPDIHHRRSIRLREYDYSSVGAYFVTVCVQERLCLYGDIVDGVMCLNDAGRMVADWWFKLPDKFPGVAVDEYVIMPNHFHGIVILNDFGRRGDTLCSPAFDVCDTLCSPAFDVCDTLCSPAFDVDLSAVNQMQNQGEHQRQNRGEHKVSPLRDQKQNRIGNKVHPNGTLENSLGRIMQAFKSLTSVDYVHGVKENGWPTFPGRLWQRNYYERVIRDDGELNGIREYIQCNPANWADDVEYETY
jgi:REP element-mobilizing transposase RayT